MEHCVEQRSADWFRLRRELVVTASRFGDAIGVGRGKPCDFYRFPVYKELKLCSRFLLDTDSTQEESSAFTQHGIDMEPIIHEAYCLLTGNRTRESGLWTVLDDKDPLKGLIGASPDAIVLDAVTKKMIGLCEFKAPVHRLYADIPRQYMVQMHGQMALTGLPWCDFMAVCQNTKEIMLKRVHFSAHFWKFVASRLLVFCQAVKSTLLHMSSSSARNFEDDNVSAIKTWSTNESSFPHEQSIKVENLLCTNVAGINCFKGPSDVTLTFDFLMGIGHELPLEVQDQLSGILEEDSSKEDQEIEKAMLSIDVDFGS